MHATLRPYATAGISLVGATAIAISPISPITPALPDIKVPAVASSSAAVDLVVNPIDFYTALFGKTVDNVGAIAEIFLENPAPILSQIIANQVSNFEQISNALTELVGAVEGIIETQVPVLLDTAFTALREGDIETALNSLLSIPVTIFAPVAFIGLAAATLPIFTALTNFVNAAEIVIGQGVLAGTLAVFGPVLSTVGATGTAVQGVIDGVMAGDIGEVVNAFINAPGVIFDGLVNGGYGPPLLGILPAPGLLTPSGLLGAVGAGPIGFVLAIRNLIAEAITPQDPDARAGAPEADAGLPEAGDAAVLSGDVVNLKLASNGEDSGTPIVDETEETPEEEGGDTEGEEGVETGGEEGASGEEGEEGDNGNGGTDLSGGNKVEPRTTASSSDASDSDSDDQQAGGSSGGSSDSGKRGTRSSREG